MTGELPPDRRSREPWTSRAWWERTSWRNRSARAGTPPRAWTRSGSEPLPDEALRPETHGVSEGDLRALPGSIVRGPLERRFRDALDGVESLREIYSGTIGYEFDHIQNAEEREWLRDSDRERRASEPRHPMRSGRRSCAG